jgi:hypothetical protein
MNSPRSGAQPEYSPAPTSDELLQRVLQATTARLSAGQPPAGDPYLAVAQRHPTLEWCLDPVAIEMVAAALSEWFHAARITPQAQTALTRQIAEALFYDPFASDRLHRWWNELRRKC